MEELWEIVKGLGALVGLATGIFVGWERIVREWPLAFIVHGPLQLGSVTMVPKLRIINRSPRPLLISWPTGDHPHEFRIARDTSIREIVSASMPGTLMHFIDGNATVDLPLFKPTHLDEIDPDNVIETRLHWAFAQPIFWKRARVIPVRMTKRSLIVLLGERSEEE